MRSRKQRAWLLWGTGGIPILITLFQATFVLIGREAASFPLVGGVAGRIRSIEFFDQIAVTFFDSSALVAFLFLAIAAGWLAQGLSMYQHRDRSSVYGGAAVASVFFFLLFWGVYWSLSPFADSELSIGARSAFFSIPVVASGCIFLAAKIYPQDIGDDIATALAEAEQALSTHEQNYKMRFEELVGDGLLDRLDELDDRGALDATETVRSEYTDHLHHVEELSEQIADQTSRDDASRERLTEVQNLRARVKALDDPEALVDQLVSTLRTKLAPWAESLLRSRCEFTSRDGVRYELNLASRYQTVRLTRINDQMTLDKLPERFRDHVENDEHELETLVGELETTLDHVETVEEQLRSEEDHYYDAESEIRQTLERIESQLSRLDGEPYRQSEKLFVQNNLSDADVTAADEIRSTLDDARTTLHECQFNKTRTALEDASAASERLVELVEFVVSLKGTAESMEAGDEPIAFSVDSAATEELTADPVVETLGTAFATTYGAGIEYDQQRNELRLVPAAEHRIDVGPGGVTTDRERSTGGSTGPITNSELDEGTIDDGVMLLLNEVRTTAQEQDPPDTVGDRNVVIELAGLPEIVTEDAVLATAERHLDGQESIEHVEINVTGSEGTFEVESTADSTAERALADAIEDYQN